MSTLQAHQIHEDRPAIIFQNPGLIDIAAVTTMGVSVKDGDSPIGYFGTGLKFAIATILREGGAITLHRGVEDYEFTARPLMVRGEVFQQVCMNGEPLGFTTQLGRNWEPWMAFRELASNCKDEGGNYFSDTGQFWLAAEGKTTICVSGCEEFAEAYRERHTIILEGSPIYSNDVFDVYEGPSRYVYFRGVRIHSPARQTALLYNVKGELELTEDRTARWSFEVQEKIAAGLQDMEDETLLRRALTCGETRLEHHLEFAGYRTTSDAFVRIGNQLAMGAEQIPSANPNVVSTARRRSLQAMRPGDGLALQQRETRMLDRAKAMLSAGGFEIDNFPLLCVETLGPSIHGLAQDGKIFVSRLAFEKGTRELAATLLEEYAHLRSGQRDCTRGFQNWLFDHLLIGVETAIGEPF